MPHQSITIAIAGGTGTIGSAIISALLPHPQYKITILSRATPSHPVGTTSTSTTTTPEFSGIEINITTQYVDYTSPKSLQNALKDINILISTLLIPSPEFAPIQLNLLHAAEKAGVTRFVPSEFALSQQAHHEVEIDKAKILVWEEVMRSVQNGKIDAGFFPCGMFMNYLAVGASFKDTKQEEEALAGFKEGGMIFYLDDEDSGPWVEIPLTETGGYPDVTMTDIRDVGRFVVAALEIEEPWAGRELGMAGDTRNLGEVVEIIQGVLGVEVEVRTVRQEELQGRLEGLGEGDVLGRMEVQYMMVCGRGGSVVRGVLNELCPDVKPISIRGFMERYWSS
ncbi:hypothetical protein BDW59DRAFT_177450 [Aspergillus cavernicola]|uniref:NmrA-like domain-containing protein n=1 Tax=Aspergillus cavernicola TaxID=176166 RepID=A0ABR4HLK2_9EURO